MAIGRSKVVIIGAGNVGTALAHHLVICNTCNNLVLINRNAEKAWAEVTDLNHSVGYYDSNIQISVGTCSPFSMAMTSRSLSIRPFSSKVVRPVAPCHWVLPM